jgi:hypothetical protein
MTYPGSILSRNRDTLEMGNEVIFFKLQAAIEIIGYSWMQRGLIMTATFFKIFGGSVEQ